MFSLLISPCGIRAQLNTSNWAPLCLAKFNMSTAPLWQPRGLVIYWHQRMPMEKRNPPKLTFHFILQNKLMKCWKALTGWWIQSKRHLKWFIGWIYLASSRPCFSQVTYLSLSWLSSSILCWNKMATEKMNEKVWIFVNTYAQHAVLSSNVSSPFKSFYVSCVFLLTWKEKNFKKLGNQLLRDQLWSKICEFNGRRWYCYRNLCLLRDNFSISRFLKTIKWKNQHNFNHMQLVLASGNGLEEM